MGFGNLLKIYGRLMNYNDIVELSKVFEKISQITTMQTDPVTPVLEKAGFMNSSHPSFLQALQLAAKNGIVQRGTTYDIGFRILPKNIIVFTFAPDNSNLQQIFSKIVGSAMQSTLTRAQIDGNGYIRNNWLNWGWV